MKRVNIYINSDIKSAKKKNGKYIYILELITDKEPITLTGTDKIQDASKNDAYTIALAKALSRMKSECKLSIFLENDYVFNAIEHYLPGWKERGWKNSKNEEIKNAEIWQQIALNLEKYDYELHCHEQHPYRDWMARQLREGKE